jgi:hypothetical protein
VLSGFDAANRGDGVDLTWQLTEIGPGTRFFIFRSDAGRPFAELHAAHIEMDGLNGTFTDRSVEPGRNYRYRVDVFDERGRQTLFTTQEIAVPVATLMFGVAEPDPFNPRTTIQYGVPAGAHVRLAIYDPQGRLVRTLVDGFVPAGVSSVEWNGRDDQGAAAASGVYFVRLTSGEHVRTSKITLLK